MIIMLILFIAAVGFALKVVASPVTRGLGDLCILVAIYVGTAYAALIMW